MEAKTVPIFNRNETDGGTLVEEYGVDPKNTIKTENSFSSCGTCGSRGLKHLCYQ